MPIFCSLHYKFIALTLTTGERGSNFFLMKVTFVKRLNHESYINPRDFSIQELTRVIRIREYRESKMSVVCVSTHMCETGDQLEEHVEAFGCPGSQEKLYVWIQQVSCQ